MAVVVKPLSPSEKHKGKTCSVCRHHMGFEQFSPRGDHHGDGYMSQCRKCANEIARARRELQRAQREAEQDRAPAIYPYQPPKPKLENSMPNPGEVAGSRYEVKRFLIQHEADSPFRYVGAGVVVRDDMSEAALAYLSRFKR
jgi:hypothetical protein